MGLLDDADALNNARSQQVDEAAREANRSRWQHVDRLVQEFVAAAKERGLRSNAGLLRHGWGFLLYSSSDWDDTSRITIWRNGQWEIENTRRGGRDTYRSRNDPTQFGPYSGDLRAVLVRALADG